MKDIRNINLIVVGRERENMTGSLNTQRRNLDITVKNRASHCGEKQLLRSHKI